MNALVYFHVLYENFILSNKKKRRKSGFSKKLMSHIFFNFKYVQHHKSKTENLIEIKAANIFFFSSLYCS